MSNLSSLQYHLFLGPTHVTQLITEKIDVFSRDGFSKQELLTHFKIKTTLLFNLEIDAKDTKTLKVCKNYFKSNIENT